jgi:hypothetical protein
MKLKAAYNRLDPDKVDLWYYYQGKPLHFATIHVDDLDEETSDELTDINTIDLELKVV